MTTTIRDVISAFAALEDGLEISEPYPEKIRRVYKYLPPAADMLDLPCVMHQYRPISEERRVNNQRERVYAVRIDVFLAKHGAQTDVWSEMAAAFDEALITAYDGNVLLTADETAHQRLFDFGGNDYQPTLLLWNEVPYVGLRYEYQVTIRDEQSQGFRA